jgi:hypothetical protein
MELEERRFPATSPGAEEGTLAGVVMAAGWASSTAVGDVRLDTHVLSQIVEICTRRRA